MIPERANGRAFAQWERFRAWWRGAVWLPVATEVAPTTGSWRPASRCVLVMAAAVALCPLPARARPGDAAGANAATSRPDGAAARDAFTFDRSMLAGSSRHVDLAHFAQGQLVMPGTYNVDVYLNQSWVGRMNVRFAAPSPDANAVPCMSRALFKRMALPTIAPQAVAVLDEPGACVAFADLVPGATLAFDMPRLRLDATVPQAFLDERPRGYVDPASWDAGVPAFRLNYRFNSYHTRSHGRARTNAYLGLEAGLNVGLWHFRQHSTITWRSAVGGGPSQRQWHNIDAYVRRDLPHLRATLTVGDSYTDGAVFDSYSLRGAQLATDDRMLPQSRRGYAPVIQGVADTNARVTVRQNGIRIYETTVSPGPFVIDDLYPTGYGGSLDVTVTEADGRQHTFTVPYASVSQLVRPGVTRFGVAVGQLRDLRLLNYPEVIQATLQHGFNNLLTGYAGFQGSQGYAAALLGVALNTRFGALALDVTQAGVSIPGHAAHTGQSVRVTWSKILPRTDTSFGVAAYRYSTRGFLSLTDAVAARDYARRGLDTFQYLPEVTKIDGVPVEGLLTPAQRAALAGRSYRPAYIPRGLLHRRNRFTVTLSQRLGRGGSLYANAAFSDYWNGAGNDTQFQVGYRNHIGRVGIGVAVSRTHNPFGDGDNRVSLSFNLPLGSGARAPTASFNLGHSDAGGTREQAMVNGTAGQWNQFNWGVTAAHDDAGSAGSVHAGYRSPYAVFHASAGAGQDYAQASVGVSGAVVAHPGGVTFGQPMGDTVAIVHAPGATGAHITNAPGVRIDGDGYALVPYLTPYQLDTIRIDPQGLPLGVQLAATSANVAPYAGAVVMVDFKSQAGRALIAHINRADGTPVPFGARVVDDQGQTLGVVGQGGTALLRDVDVHGRLIVTWNGKQSAVQTCEFAYALRELSQSATAYQQIHTICQARATAMASPSGENGT